MTYSIKLNEADMSTLLLMLRTDVEYYLHDYEENGDEDSIDLATKATSLFESVIHAVSNDEAVHMRMLQHIAGYKAEIRRLKQ